jgi:hypothetical protein
VLCSTRACAGCGTRAAEGHAPDLCNGRHTHVWACRLCTGDTSAIRLLLLLLLSPLRLLGRTRMPPAYSMKAVTSADMISWAFKSPASSCAVRAALQLHATHIDVCACGQQLRHAMHARNRVLRFRRRTANLARMRLMRAPLSTSIVVADPGVACEGDKQRVSCSPHCVCVVNAAALPTRPSFTVRLPVTSLFAVPALVAGAVPVMPSPLLPGRDAIATTQVCAWLMIYMYRGIYK